MNDQFSLQIIENVKAVIDKNYPDLKGHLAHIEKFRCRLQQSF